MKTGIKLIAAERKEQIEKHHRTLKHDVIYNSKGQLIKGAMAIIDHDHKDWPGDWEVPIYIRIMDKPLKERLIIAAALIAAEIDRLQTPNQ